jgi:DNA-binding beta-propeller fold protein YncE
VVATVSPDVLGDLPVEAVIASNFDVPIGIALSFDGTQLFIGSAFSSALFVVDATTLALTQTVPVLPSFSSMTVNRTVTRLYASPGDSTAQEIPLDTFDGGAHLAAAAEVVPNGTVVDATGASLVVHLADSTIDTIRPFEDLLVGSPILVTDQTYTLKVIGSPSQPFVLAAAAAPGFLDYGPANADPRQFLDMDIATFHPLFNSVLDATGELTFTTVIASSSGLAGASFLLQAIVVDPNTGQPGEPTNVMALRVVNP